MEDLKVRALERRQFFNRSYDSALQERQEKGFHSKIAKLEYPEEETHRSVCNYTIKNIDKDDIHFDFVEYDEGDLKALQIIDSTVNASDELADKLLSLHWQVQSFVKDIHDGVVEFRRVAPPKNGIITSSLIEKTLTPISITSETSEDELNDLTENSAKKIREKIQRKKYEAFTRKLRNKELK